ncbi:MAG: tetratricopeptide repeat protein [Pirellulaceae bacterium]|jgi:tetratricopeptide (TPR) repeat protein|nr:tetratricopeptide repeat protein [Pirellulaceae bacterium]
MSAAESADGEPALLNLRVAFAGRLGGMSRRAAQQLVREHGGTPVDDPCADAVDMIVIGADELPLREESLLDDTTRARAGAGDLEVISETELWRRLGLLETEATARLYTPAMLAELLQVPLSVIRRWHRRGLIVPVREVRRLPYFDFQEVATARQLAALVAAGASPEAIEKQLAELARYVPDVQRPLAQLSVIVQGRQLLLRQGDGLIEPGGQLRIDFEALDHPAEPAAAEAATVSLPTDNMLSSSPAALRDLAAQYEDEGHLEQAAELYRAALAAAGPSAEVCFQLAELLYRLGDLPGARERYYIAIELDEDYVEARANLGCVLAETGQGELAVAAFQGALRYHRDYPDAHYHLARTLDELGRPAEAEQHWRAFLALASESPWTDEARHRLRGAW